MKVKLLFIGLLLLTASCSNYNNIRFVNSGEFSPTEKIASEPNMNELEVPADDPSCDTVYFRNGEVKTFRVGKMSKRKVDVYHCNYGTRWVRELNDIDSIKYASGFIWNEHSNQCDTIIFKDGTKQIRTIKTINEKRIKTKLCDINDHEQKESIYKMKNIELIIFSNGGKTNSFLSPTPWENDPKRRKRIRTLMIVSSVIVTVIALLLGIIGSYVW